MQGPTPSGPLTGEGVSPEEARLRLLDDGLWISPLALRWEEPVVGEDAAKRWDRVSRLAEGFGGLAMDEELDVAIVQAAFDVAERASEVARRARHRANRVGT